MFSGELSLLLPLGGVAGATGSGAELLAATGGAAGATSTSAGFDTTAAGAGAGEWS